MLKKLFGKKNKQEDYNGHMQSNEPIVMPPGPLGHHFYHGGQPLNSKPSIRNTPYVAFPNMGIYPQQEVFTGHHASINEMEPLSPERMAVYQHKSLQEKLMYGDDSFGQMEIFRALEASRVDEAVEEIRESAEQPNGFELRLQELADKEIYGVRVNGQNYGYHFGFHDPKCEIPAYQKEKVQMNHVKVGKTVGRVVALRVWCDEKDGELPRTETIYVRLEKIDALILYDAQTLGEEMENNEWKAKLISEQQGNSFKLHTLNETYLLEEIQCESSIFGTIQVDYKIIGMGTDDIILNYTFKQRTSGEKAHIQKERLKIYIPIDKVVSIETK